MAKNPKPIRRFKKRAMIALSNSGTRVYLMEQLAGLEGLPPAEFARHWAEFRRPPAPSAQPSDTTPINSDSTQRPG